MLHSHRNVNESEWELVTSHFVLFIQLHVFDTSNLALLLRMRHAAMPPGSTYEGVFAFAVDILARLLIIERVDDEVEAIPECVSEDVLALGLHAVLHGVDTTHSAKSGIHTLAEHSAYSQHTPVREALGFSERMSRRFLLRQKKLWAVSVRAQRGSNPAR